MVGIATNSKGIIACYTCPHLIYRSIHSKFEERTVQIRYLFLKSMEGTTQFILQEKIDQRDYL